ncbi:ABC transporter ATP-binding protein [Marinomonas sp. 15G1-11]|uniref:ABC transporter ATP-binding protein n=1 Tax=Marinomonas phaeophyticola TaxID=3004091 RepID=A0ABT4JU35_9GAMM|nr:ABC transporter ATP-binding protein [Marinomonas sp. 15G1-11]MCZ2721850.1 ABC transporter ATP-binding protein [Marinomonas sp. 15G1-11]
MFEFSQLIIERNQRPILDIPNLTLATDKLTVILGKNGSGKTTLMQCLARQLHPSKGCIRFKEKPLLGFSQRQLAQEIAFLPQSLSEAAGLTIRELVQLGRFPWHGTWGRWRQKDHDIVTQSLKQVGLSHYENQLVEEASGGEKQRAWIAMLLAQQSPVLLLDEPTSALDISHQYELLSLLQKLNRETGQGIIIILHDVNLAARYADRILAIDEGRCVFHGTVDDFMKKEQLESLYNIPMTLINHPENNTKVALAC